MGCASSAASNQRPDAEAGEKAGHRPLVSENPGDAARMGGAPPQPLRTARPAAERRLREIDSSGIVNF